MVPLKVQKNKDWRNGRILTDAAKQRKGYLLPSDKFCIDFCIFKNGTSKPSLRCGHIHIPTPASPRKILEVTMLNSVDDNL